MRLGTCGSPLALVQAAMVRDALVAAHEIAVEIVTIQTTVDPVKHWPLAAIGGEALWARGLDRALLGGEVDATVHPMKDVETLCPSTIAITAILPCADVRDRLVSAPSIAALRAGATVDTGSP